MEKNIGRLFTVLVLVCFLSSGCSRKKTTMESTGAGQTIKDFSIEFFGDSFKANLKGEAAEKKSSDSDASVAKPSLEINSKNFVVQINTGPKGSGEVFLDSSTQNIEKIVIKNNITVVQKNPETSQVNFTAKCDQLTYIEKDETVIMEGSPELVQGLNKYKADKIVYNLNENRLKFEGNVQIFFKKGSVN